MAASEHRNVSVSGQGVAHLGDVYINVFDSGRTSRERGIQYYQEILGRLVCDRLRDTAVTPITPEPQSSETEKVLQSAASSSGKHPWFLSKARSDSLARKRCPCGQRPHGHRMFRGRVVVKQYGCKQCGRSLTEITIRTPQWLTQYNLYLMGSPERILKLQRRVPWGTEESILKHCLTGNLDEVRYLLLSRRASLYDIDPNHGRTPLHYAVQKGHADICDFLLFAGADPDFEDYSGTTAECKAWEQILARRGTATQSTQFRQLFGAYDRDDQAFTHLHYVVVGERPVALVEVLQEMRYREQLNTVDVRGRTPLHWACDRGDALSVEALVNAGADLNVKDGLGSTSLIFAASSGNMTIINKLLEGGAEVKVHTIRGDSPLHFASRHQNEVAVVRALVEAGASVDHKNSMHNTAFAGAAMMNRCEIGRYLIKMGADIHTRGMYGDTPLFETIYHNNHEFMKMLLEHGVRTMEVNYNDYTILHAVGFEGGNETVSLLCDSGATLPNAQIKNKFGEDAWMMLGKRLKVPKGFGTLFRQLLTRAESS